MQITLEDQDENRLNLRGENITVRFHIRENKNYLNIISVKIKMSKYTNVKVNISEGQR